MHVHVVDDARSRTAAEVPAEVVPVGAVFRVERGESGGGEPVDVERLVVGEIGRASCRERVFGYV